MCDMFSIDKQFEDARKKAKPINFWDLPEEVVKNLTPIEKEIYYLLKDEKK